MVSSGLQLAEILCLFPSLLPLKLLATFNSFLKLDTPGFWASGCSWFFFHYSDALSLTCIFPSTYVRFTQDSSWALSLFLSSRHLSTFPKFQFFTSNSQQDIVHQLFYLCPILTAITIESICKVLYCLESVLPTVFHLSSIALPILLLFLFFPEFESWLCCLLTKASISQSLKWG